MAIGGGRIDRLDVMQEEDRVYVKIIDYKTGNTSFDLVSIYYGLQMQLVVYMDAAMQAEQRKHPDCQVRPAGIFYYNVKDPMLQKEMEEDLDELDRRFSKAENEWPCHGRQGCDRESGQDYDLIAIVLYDKGNTSKRFFCGK